MLELNIYKVCNNLGSVFDAFLEAKKIQSQFMFGKKMSDDSPLMNKQKLELDLSNWMMMEKLREERLEIEIHLVFLIASLLSCFFLFCKKRMGMLSGKLSLKELQGNCF